MRRRRGGEVSRTGSVAYETRRRILLQHLHKVFPLKSFPLFFFLSVASAVGFAKAFLPYALTATKDTRAKQAKRESKRESTGNRKKEKSLAICIRYNWVSVVSVLLHLPSPRTPCRFFIFLRIIFLFVRSCNELSYFMWLPLKHTLTHTRTLEMFAFKFVTHPQSEREWERGRERGEKTETSWAKEKTFFLCRLWASQAAKMSYTNEMPQSMQ